MTPHPDRSTIIFDWWKDNLQNANDSNARALSARLRRATTMVETLSERAVFELGKDLHLNSKPEILALLASTLAHVDDHKSQTFAKCCGEVVGQSGDGKQKKNSYKLSETRFQNVARCEEPMELATQLRRALPIIGKTCDVGRLGEDLMKWFELEQSERTRARWWFDYFGGTMPAATEKETTETEEATS
jgi:CRISPR system Cascade subunit CasB